MEKKFDIILFLGRPAAGKSEIIDFLKSLPLKERRKKYHIAQIYEIDDFKFIWARGEKDDRREKRGLERVDTNRIKVGGYIVKNKEIYKSLISDINREFKKRFDEKFFRNNTLFIEFSRGGKDGYKKSLELLDKQILKRAVIYYVKVSYKESLRKNQRRYDPSKPDSILFHTVPLKVMKKYKIDDWENLTKDENFIEINKIKVPYAVFQNEPEKTNSPTKIKEELGRGIEKLFENYQKKEVI